MTYRMRRLAMALSVALLAGCTQHTPPRAHDTIKFSHGTHLRQGTQCTHCHAVIRPSGVLAPGIAPADATPQTADEALAAMPLRVQGGAPKNPKMPTEAQCRQCHTKPEEQRCGFCHTHPEAADTFASEGHGLHFDHQAHSGRHADVCMRCHGVDLSQSSVSSFEPRIPPMRSCTQTCHAEDLSALHCSRCHTDLHRYPKPDMRVVRHPPGFLHQHGARARASDGLCSQCHEPTFCSDCHTASPNVSADLLAPMDVTRQFIHSADFRARHPSEARLDQATCLRCHGPSFCDGCHRETGVGGGVGQSSPHPPGWLDPLSPRGHAREARRNILTCAACHESDAERLCVPCHRVGSIAGNPHPAGFGVGIDPNQRGVCRVCHTRSP
ncbi:MAG TPA: hypothetical protein VF331_06570 [Polyangiales bacterium]